MILHMSNTCCAKKHARSTRYILLHTMKTVLFHLLVGSPTVHSSDLPLELP